MISNQEYVERAMRRLQIRRRSTLHNGETRPFPLHKPGCPCSTIPHTADELRLLESIESLLTELVHRFASLNVLDGGGDGRPEWTDTASTT